MNTIGLHVCYIHTLSTASPSEVDTAVAHLETIGIAEARFTVGVVHSLSEGSAGTVLAVAASAQLQTAAATVISRSLRTTSGVEERRHDEEHGTDRKSRRWFPVHGVQTILLNTNAHQ